MEKYLTKQAAEEIGEIFSASVEELKSALPDQLAELWSQVPNAEWEEAAQQLIEDEMEKIDSTVRAEIGRLSNELSKPVNA